ACTCCGACFTGLALVGASLRYVEAYLTAPGADGAEGPKDGAAATAPAPVEAVPNGTAASVAAGQPGQSLPAKNQSRELYDACWYGDFDGAYDALEAGADCNATFGVRKICSLHVAARTGNTAIMNMLLSSAPQVDLRNKDGETPLFGAVTEGHVGTTQALVEARADVNARDHEGRTVLQIAETRGYQDFVEFLTSCGAKAGTAETAETGG
ncbi:unnamed protein product, partial [Cladocopium goreaui]